MAPTYSIRDCIWATLVVAILSVLWLVLLSRKNDQKEMRLMYQDYHARLTAIKQDRYTANREDIELLLYALCDPYFPVAKTAEDKLLNIAKDNGDLSSSIPTLHHRNRIEVINAWTSWYLTEIGADKASSLPFDKPAADPFEVPAGGVTKSAG
jgi:hypothetical protein